jgi:hypothetical protein
VPGPLSADERRRMRIVSAGMLVGVMVILGVALCARQIMLCGVALLIGSNLLPLAAALVPAGTMVLRFPRASAPS